MGTRTGWFMLLSEAESRHVIIKLEMLAVVWAANKCQTFLMDLKNFQVITAHNPLVSILNSHNLDEIDNPRLQWHKTKLMVFNVAATWCKGDTNRVPDALSHYLVWELHQSDSLAKYDEGNFLELSAGL